MKKYLIINECFSSNFGDQAINKSLINLFKENKILTHSELKLFMTASSQSS